MRAWKSVSMPRNIERLFLPHALCGCLTRDIGFTKSTRVEGRPEPSPSARQW